MLKPLIKYPGGKERELKYILPNIPSTIDRYFEPFVGGGAVYFAVAPALKSAFINDKSKDLMLLYKSIKQNDSLFFNYVKEIIDVWAFMDKIADESFDSIWTYFLTNNVLQINKIKYKFDFNEFNLNKSIFYKQIDINLNRKIQYAYKQKEKKKEITKEGFYDLIHTAFKSSAYTYYRYTYNHVDLNESERAALYLFIRQYAYSSMFRFSKSGFFNVPYGGKSYNDIFLTKKLDYFHDKKLNNLLNKTELLNLDFEKFLNEFPPKSKDFMFVDPPYDTDFSKYDNLSFGAQEQIRLANFLIEKVNCKWMLVIKNTQLIRSLYKNGTKTSNNGILKVNFFKKNYSVNFKNRNLRSTKHLIITNY
jgi:DNA adenine methylase